MREVSAYLLTIEPSAKSSGPDNSAGCGLERKRPRLQFCALEASRQPGRLRSSHGPGFFDSADKPPARQPHPIPPSKFSQLSAPPRRMETLFAA